MAPGRHGNDKRTRLPLTAAATPTSGLRLVQFAEPVAEAPHVPTGDRCDAQTEHATDRGATSLAALHDLGDAEHGETHTNRTDDRPHGRAAIQVALTQRPVLTLLLLAPRSPAIR